MRTKRHGKSQVEVKREQTFIRTICGILQKHGAEPALTEDPTQYTIDTQAGELKVHVYGNWIACRFDDVDKAKRLLPHYPKDPGARLNGFSGKWNFHYQITNLDIIQIAGEDFEANLRQIL